MMFMLDIDSQSKNMETLAHIQKALQGVVKDLQQKIDRGQDKGNCNGDVKDASGNSVGGWEFICEDIEDELPF